MGNNCKSGKQENNIIQGHFFYRKFGKRLIDILFSVLALIILSPLLLVLMLLVRLIHGSPVFFTPTRPGKDEKIFRLYKFRTMSNAVDKEGKLLPEKDRVTLLGKFLRKTSLDEIPELLNIFKGDMSIVGPRPLAMKYLPYYSENERMRHSVRPGLTGLAQISGRNNLPWPNRFEKDLEYVRDMSFRKDISIIFGTVGKLFGDKDVTVPGNEKKYQFDTYRIIEEEGRVTEYINGLSVPEIGGAFWTENATGLSTGKGIEFPSTIDSTYTLSGRSAITLALRDAGKLKSIRRAYIPSYISFSMLQPFIQEDIEYRYYKVTICQGKVEYAIDRNYPCDVFFAVDYYGLDNSELNKYISFFKHKECVVIKDITHVFLNNYDEIRDADYYVASLRKWFAIPAGGWLGKSTGSITVKPDKEGDAAVEKIKAAMMEKKEYIRGIISDKTKYLEEMSRFESDLVQLDPLLKLDSYSVRVLEQIDVDFIKFRRKENAKVLYNQLSDIKGVHFLNTKEEFENNVPLFVPICLEHGDRDHLKHSLMEKGIYCPVHWPETMGATPGIRDQELSLVCDQRYTTNDMLIMSNVIRKVCCKEV